MSPFENKNIAYILSQYPNLSETFVDREIIHLRNLGANIIIISLKSSNDNNVYYANIFKIIGANIFFVLKNPYLYFSTIAKILEGLILFEFKAVFTNLIIFLESIYFVRIIKYHKIDHIHAHFLWGAGTSAWIISRLSKIPYSITVHAFDIFKRELIDNLFKIKLNDASFIVAISEYNKKYITDKYGISSGKIHVIHCGVENSLLDLSPIRFNNKVPFIVSVGRFTAKKGFKYLLEALKILKEYKVNYKAVIVGEGEDMNYMLSHAAALEIKNEICFKGALPNKEVISLIREADIFVLPCIITESGDMDGIPVVLMEAMAIGLPVISTIISGIPELIEDGVSGLLVPDKNSSALANALLLLINNQNKRIQIGLFAKDKVNSGFMIEDNVKKLAKLFSISS